MQQPRDSGKVLKDRIRSETASLIRQFGHRTDPDQVEEEMAAAVSRFHAARIKDFVPLLAGRIARDRLQSLVLD